MRHRASRLALAVLLTVAACTGLAVVTSPAAAAPYPGSRYVAVTPQRVLDTRMVGDSPIGGGQTRVVDFGAEIPVPVVAVVVNITTVNTTAGGYLTVFPHGTTRPVISNVQHPKGVARASSVTVAVTNQGAGRYVDVFNNAGSVDIVVDLFGYYVDDAAAGGLPVTSYRANFNNDGRVYDSRKTGTKQPFGNGETRAVVVTTGGATGVKAVAVNLTVVTPGGPGYLQAWSGSGAAPTISNVNFVKGHTTPNFAIVPVRCANPACTSTAITIRNVSASAHVLVDLLGEYRSSGGARYFSVAPYRTIDTRSDDDGAPLGPHDSTFELFEGAVPHTPPSAVNLTVTAVQPTAPTYLQVYPDPGPTTTSTVNALPGEVVANATQVVPESGFGIVQFRNEAGHVHLVVDVTGYFDVAPEE